jgi:hypothetical protein
VTLLKPQVTVKGYFLWANPASVPQPTKRHRSSSSSNAAVPLPPQEWTVDNYLPVIDPASIPLPPKKHRSSTSDATLPTITVTSPADKTKTPSKPLLKIKKVYQEDVLERQPLTSQRGLVSACAVDSQAASQPVNGE